MTASPHHSRRYVMALGCILPVLFVASVRAQGEAQASAEGDDAYGPDVVILDELENEYEPVEFSHRVHAEMAEMWNGCTTCHHRSPEPQADADGQPLNDHQRHSQDVAAAIPKCKSCHATAPDKVDIHMPGLRGAYHRQCLNCHKAWAGENGCVNCHAPKDRDAGGPRAKANGDDITGRLHPPIKPPIDKVFVARYVPAAGAKVLFRHELHLERYGLKCANCHHRDACADCHGTNGDTRRHKAVEPAISWKQSHGPCMTCHQNQSCNHCHYPADAAPPAAFDHAATGQHLDADHAELKCTDCHRKLDFDAEPTCGNGKCHGQADLARAKPVSFPDDRPGKHVEPTLAAGMSPARSTATWASLTPRPLRPPEMQGHNLFTPIGETTRRVAASHEPSPRPALPEPGDPSCVTDDCHVSIKAAKRLHGPVNVDACDVCHQLTDETEHRFALKRSDTELCTFCHEFDVSGMPKVHKPVALGQCLGCHDPHGSSRLNLTREESTVAMCGRCHGNTIDGHKSLHTPVAQGQCLACHAPHASQMPDMLDVVGTDLCLTCHDQFGEQLAAVKFTHEALEEQCTYCHDAHGASEPMALRQPIIKLCTECHEDTRQQMTAATFAHGSATQDGRACLNCHTAHGGNFKALMRSLPAVACMQCHDKSLQTPDGRIIAAASDMLDDSLVRHGPIAEGQCGGCHAPHGGQREALLTGDYSDRLRQRYSADRYALCFSCHDEKLAVQQPEDAEPATAFRNGDVNLHAVHVNDAWGRACVACHATHTAPNAKLIRPSLRVKNWEAPMVFRATPTGGYCASGCHHPLKYDRETPLPIGTQLEPTVPAVSRSQHNDRPPVRFTAMDIDGQELAVPHSERMTLIVALRSPRDDIERAVQPILAALPEQRDFELVMLVNGDDAKQAAGALAAMQDFGGRVVPDERSELTHTLNVQAWPAVVLVAPDGRERARIHGTAVTLALRLEGYLAADAQTDEPARQAAAVANGSRDTGVRQYLQLVEQWSRHGQTERALKIAREAVALHPEEPQLQAMLANALNATGRPDEALKVLDALPPDAAELVLARASRAEALMLLDRWDDAEQIARTLIETEPALSTGYLLLGRVHEHHSRWREAAEVYRHAYDLAKQAP